MTDTTQSLDEVAEILAVAYSRSIIARRKWQRGKHFDAMRAAVDTLTACGYHIGKDKESD